MLTLFAGIILLYGEIQLLVSLDSVMWMHLSMSLYHLRDPVHHAVSQCCSESGSEVTAIRMEWNEEVEGLEAVE